MKSTNTKEEIAKIAEIETNKEIPKSDVFCSTRKSLILPITESRVKKNVVAANREINNALFI